LSYEMLQENARHAGHSTDEENAAGHFENLLSRYALNWFVYCDVLDRAADIYLGEYLTKTTHMKGRGWPYLRPDIRSDSSTDAVRIQQESAAYDRVAVEAVLADFRLQISSDIEDL